MRCCFILLLGAIHGAAWSIMPQPLPARRQRTQITMAAAAHKRPRTQNAPGNLFVDEGCIDCDVCRWMCPGTFARKGVKAAVHTQPETDTERLLAHAAAVACPVGSIRTRLPDPLAKRALTVFPAEIDPVNLPGVCHLGYHSAGTCSLPCKQPHPAHSSHGTSAVFSSQRRTAPRRTSSSARSRTRPPGNSARPTS